MTTELDYFPYPTIRPQQQQIMDFIRCCFESRTVSIIEAATGIGKTVAALVPIIELQRSLNADIDDEEQRYKILVLGRTHSQADRVIDELTEIALGRKASLPAVAKRGKKALCIHPMVRTKPNNEFNAVCSAFRKNKSCSFFYNALQDEYVFDLLNNQPTSSQEILEESQANNCCPAEITNQLVKHADIISGSYHYLFNPKIRNLFLQSLEINLDRLIVVVDECHNLPEATINMTSVRINSAQLLSAETEIRQVKLETEHHHYQKKYSDMINSILSVIKVDEETRIAPMDLLKGVESGMRQLGSTESLVPEDVDMLQELAAEIVNRSASKHYAFTELVADMVEMIFELYQRNDALITMFHYDSKDFLELKIMDPSKEIATMLYTAKQAVLMTGTLGNASIFRAMTGLRGRTKVLQLPSPYEQELGVYHLPGLTSKYTERSDEMYQYYVRTIHAICTQSVNIGLYVPSYSFLNQLLDQGLDRTSKPVFVANRSMRSIDTEAMLDDFRAMAKKGGGLLCSVMGGRSSEGTDFPGDEMEIVIIVGLPYPPQTIETEARLDYYQQFTSAAWDICYTTPAFRSINQAAGRAVRSLEDRAMIFLLDDRVLKNKRRLTNWLRSKFQSISHDKLPATLEEYFG